MCCRRSAEAAVRQSEVNLMQQLHRQIMYEKDSRVKPVSADPTMPQLHSLK